MEQHGIQGAPHKALCPDAHTPPVVAFRLFNIRSMTTPPASGISHLAALATPLRAVEPGGALRLAGRYAAPGQAPAIIFRPTALHSGHTVGCGTGQSVCVHGSPAGDAGRMGRTSVDEVAQQLVSYRYV